jgi:hypothetical protein
MPMGILNKKRKEKMRQWFIWGMAIFIVFLFIFSAFVVMFH